MIEDFIITEFLTNVAGLLTSLSVIGGAVYQWIWKPYATKKEEREEKWRNDMLEISKKQTMPIVTQLETLAERDERHDEMNKKLEEIAEQNVAIIKEIRQEFKEHNRQADQRNTLIEQNAKILKQHDDRLDNHSDRILILETYTGVPKERSKNKEDK